MMILIATYISIVIGTGSLAWGYAHAGFDGFARWLLFAGLIWAMARWQRWWWVSALALMCAIAIAAVGMWFEVSPGWMLCSGIFVLIAWNLTDFSQRSRFTTNDEELRGVQRRHLGRVTLLALEGMILCTLIMWMRSELTIEWLDLVAVVFFLGLLQLILRFRSR